MEKTFRDGVILKQDDMKAKDMLLRDALETAIESEKKNIKLKKIIVIQMCVIIALFLRCRG